MAELKIKGRTFSSLRKACFYYELNYATVCHRVNSQNFSIEQALTKALKNTEITMNGKKFKSFKHMCNYYKVLPCTVQNRISRGWSKEEALGIVARGKISKCEGIIYKITNEVNNKIYIGLTTKKLQNRFEQHKRSVVNGSTTKLHKAMKIIGINKFKIQKIKSTSCRKKLYELEIKYIRKYNSYNKGYNGSRGGSSVGDKWGKSLIYKGKEYVSCAALAKHLNINEYSLRSYISKGLPIEKAGNIGKNRCVEVNNIKFDSLTSACRFYKINITTISYRLKVGLCLNDAFNREKRAHNRKKDLLR